MLQGVFYILLCYFKNRRQLCRAAASSVLRANGNLSSLQVSDFTWSHDGTQALIAYRDGFVLVGSVSGQRHWSSEINLESQITCGIWTPDDQQVHAVPLCVSLSLFLLDLHNFSAEVLILQSFFCPGLVRYSRWPGDSDGLSRTNARPCSATRVRRHRQHVLELP